MNKAMLVLMAAAWCSTSSGAAPLPTKMDVQSLDLDIQYYTRVQTPEGVTREARYKETMMRRPGHVWVERILPGDKHGADRHAASAGKASHAEFNPAVTPHHVMLENSKARIEYVDQHDRVVVAIPSSEYANVNFDGSWANTFFLIDPKVVGAMPRTARKSPVPGAEWHEREKNGVFDRVLWDQKRQIPLMIESGDRAQTFYRSVEVNVRPASGTPMPWENLSGYAQKEYSDYLD